MWKQFTAQNTTYYLDILSQIVEEYNNTKHTSIKMTPNEASHKNNEGLVYFNLYGNTKQLIKTPAFKVGDKVRISKYNRKVFDKGYTPNWTEEVFIINKIQYRNPITYIIKDLHDEQIQGSFYKEEKREKPPKLYSVLKKLLSETIKRKQP